MSVMFMEHDDPCFCGARNCSGKCWYDLEDEFSREEC